jgi:uncharacterized protein (TIGR03437 family)
VSLFAQDSQGLKGASQVNGTLQSNPGGVPLIFSGGAVSNTSFAPLQALAPGDIIAIFGNNLATTTKGASSLPLPSQLAGTRAYLGDKEMPLLLTTSGQLDAIIPFDIPLNTSHQLIVQQNELLSLPESVAVAATHPAIATQNGTGSGLGAIQLFHSDGSVVLVGPSQPAGAGDVLIIYCTGLGASNPPVASGTASPASPPSSPVNSPTVTIGGKNAQVLGAALTPGFASLYQVNIIVPSGVVPGPDAPVIVTSDGMVSPPVTIPVR